MIVERDEDGWYVGSVPELPGCHTQGSTMEELDARMREAIGLYLEDTGEERALGASFVGVHSEILPSLRLPALRAMEL